MMVRMGMEKDGEEDSRSTHGLAPLRSSVNRLIPTLSPLCLLPQQHQPPHSFRSKLILNTLIS